MYPKDHYSHSYPLPNGSVHHPETRPRVKDAPVQNPYVVTITTILGIMMADKSISKEDSKKYITSLRQQLDAWEKLTSVPEKRKDDKPEPPKKKRKSLSTPYEIFCDEKREELKRLEPEITEQEIVARLRIGWREISDLEAERYIRLADDRKSTSGSVSDPYAMYQPFSYNYVGAQAASHENGYAQESYSQGYPGPSPTTYGYLHSSGQTYPSYSGQIGFEKRY